MCAYGRGGRVGSLGDAMFLNPEANGKGGRLPPIEQSNIERPFGESLSLKIYPEGPIS